MLISKVLDEAGGEGRRAAGAEAGDHAPEYQTASELFELMTKDTPFNSIDDGTLSTRDLVLLYKNIDIGTKLMNDATGVTSKKHNQHVETVVYNDEPGSESDLSEINSTEDIFMVNQERLDFLDDKSLENLLSHKFGGLEIKSSDRPADFDKKFTFKDAYFTNQLKNLNIMGSTSDFTSIFSTSLIDYICCKRLEDNYNFYMDNIIKYVQHTIEQLKRISNGDYLTERAKEKWREVNSKEQTNDTKVLATSTSIPLHVECKRNRNATWDDIVHSEVDVRSLSKILEKKIVLEIPKLLSGSFRLYSKRCYENLIIRCQKEKQTFDKEGQESRLDVVLQLQRSQTGQVVSNISSIMILRTTPALSDLGSKKILPLPYKDHNDETVSSEDHDSKGTADSKETTDSNGTTDSKGATDSKGTAEDAIYLNDNDTDAVSTELESDNTPFEEEHDMSEHQQPQLAEPILDISYISYYQNTTLDTDPLLSSDYLSESKSAARDIDIEPVFPLRNEEKAYNLISPDELRIAMKRLSMRTSVLDETGEDLISTNASSKKSSPVRVRIKSPYENKSFLMEEKKRKRLLEIRERREKKKLALSENCKISKHKYGKAVPMPQASNSVTKLSITNKSFYNSIYGQSLNVERKSTKGGKVNRKGLKNNTTSSLEIIPIEPVQEDFFESPMLSPDKNSKKYINRSYYLDDAETEMMYTQMKPNISASNSAGSEFNSSLNLLTHFIGQSDMNLTHNDLAYLADDKPQSLSVATCSGGTFGLLPIADRVVNTIPTTKIANDALTSKKNPSGDECRKSIDQVYSLIKKFSKSNGTAEFGRTNSKVTIDASDGIGDRSNIQATESGTSVKHHATSSNDSSFCAEKNSIIITKSKSVKNPAAVVSKVVISSKSHAPKIGEDALRKDRKRVTVSSPRKEIPENPIKAISQLLLQIDNVQKTRLRTVPEIKSPKKTEVVPNDVKTRPSYFRRHSRLEQHLQDNDKQRKPGPTHTSPKDKRTRPGPPTELARMPHQQFLAEDKRCDKITKKKLADIIDEATEARGEAVRGPSKLNSRLNSLAQPKKSYVQAHHEEYQNRYGKNILADRLQRLAGAGVTAPAPAPAPEKRSLSPRLSLRNRARRSGAEATSQATVKLPAPSPPHIVSRATKGRRSTSSSPTGLQESAGRKHNVPGAPEPIPCCGSKKGAPVEPLVKPQRRSSPVKELLAGYNTRVPLLPHDFELVSSSSSAAAEESNELGHTLHRMIDSVLTSVSTATPLSSLPEHTETTYQGSETVYSVNVASIDLRSESDYHIDILQDETLKTAVETIEDTRLDTNDDDLSELCQPPIDPRGPTSVTEMKKLENALYSQISGAFQKRLRIKNLTLTPKPSLQQVFVVQSGDAGSLLVKSTMSSLKLNKCAESLHDLKVLPVLSNSTLDWTFAQIPVQIATVGYAFPEYQTRVESGSKAKLLNVSSIEGPEIAVPHACTSHKDIQCFKGIHQNSTSDANAHSNVEKIAGNFSAEFVTVPVESLNSHVTMSEIDQIKISNVKLHALETVNEVDSRDNFNPNEKTDNVKAVSTAEEKIKTSSEPTPVTDFVEYTTSLDMLVGILNEIQKITCQNQMAAVNNDHNSASLEPIPKDDTARPAPRKSEKNIACSRELISITSLDNLRQLESTASIYNVSNDDETTENNIESTMEDESISTVFVDRNTDIRPLNYESVNKETDVKDTSWSTKECKPTGVDKEVSANICDKKYVNNFTDVQSSLGTIAVSHDTIVTSSVIGGDGTAGGVSEAARQSLLSVVDYNSLYSNRLFCTPVIKNAIVLPKNEVKEPLVLISRDKTDLNEKCFKKSISLIRNFQDVKNEKSLIARSELKKYCVKNIDFDPMLKIKRDILVTVYSILVLTVFAALSFPELVMLH